MGMVVGLVDIFGFALVLNYLTINLSFWFSVLLHVLNNSCVILIPMLFVGEPIHVETAQYTIDATPFKAFADNSRCWDSVNYEDVHQVSWNGELPEIVCFLYSFGTAVINDSIIYDWRGGESLESRYFMKAQCKDNSVVAIGSVKVYRDIARLLMQEAKVVADTDVVVAACQPKLLSFYDRGKFEYAGAAGGYIDCFGYPFCRGARRMILPCRCCGSSQLQYENPALR